jgi:hypothetical protein
MQYFEASDGKLERIGKVIGDALAALVVLCVIILASGLILFWRARCGAFVLDETTPRLGFAGPMKCGTVELRYRSMALTPCQNCFSAGLQVP